MAPPANAIMFQGTGSHVGKSVLTAALCRILAGQGLRVLPFKAMNMSNNASVTPDGGEIATAQAVQAKACGVSPRVEMNPVLLKTVSDSTCQVIVMGKPLAHVRAGELSKWRPQLLQAIEGALSTLQGQADCIVIEGAGSPAEINLKETDVANMVVAEMAGASVLLIADIERGGVFAQLVGTLDLLEPSDRDRVAGFIINKFRGEFSLLEPGLEWLTRRTGKPVFGVVPYWKGLRIPEEDSLGIPSQGSSNGEAPIRIWVVQYPTISNFTDFDPLRYEPQVDLRFLTSLPAHGDLPDLLILPGSKSTVSDLAWLLRSGFDRLINRCAEKKVEVLGVCGGFQMLGEMIYDPSHVESREAAVRGLGLLPISTLFLSSKVTTQVEGFHVESGEPVRGYEIHMGRLQGARRGKPVFQMTRRGGQPVQEWDGCRLPEKKIWGTYLHGLFDEPGFRRYLLNRIHPSVRPSVDESQEDPFDDLAARVRSALSWKILQEKVPWLPLSEAAPLPPPRSWLPCL